jgi:hypothetical protein
MKDFNAMQEQNTIIAVIILLCIILLLILGAYFQKLFTRMHKRKQLIKHTSDGQSGERLAKEYLLKNGFTIENEQIHKSCSLAIDEKPQEFSLRADFLVSKNGRYSIVDAKSGADCSNITHQATRRQLLEYFVYYDVDSVYLFDSINSMLHEIEFPIDKKQPVSPFIWVMVGQAVAIAFLIAMISVIIVK